MLAEPKAEIDTRAVRREATRARILEAAWRLARRDGLAAVSLRDLAQEVGMRAPSLYRYFASKNAMYDAMFAESVQLLGETVGQRQVSEDPRETLRDRLQRFVAFFTEDPVRFQLVDQRPIPGFEPSPASYAFSVANIAEVRKDLDAAGCVGEQAHDMWRALVTGLVNQQISNDPGGDRWTRLTDDALDMYLAHWSRPRKGA